MDEGITSLAINSEPERISNKDLIYQEVRAIAELYFEGEKVEGIIATVLGGVAMERWASFAKEQFPGTVGECP